MSATDEVTDAMAHASVNEPNGTEAEAPVDNHHDEAVAAANASAEEGRRLYIGNLAYATTEGELKDFFKDYTIESTSIPLHPRTQRPVGYAFVDLATVDEAHAAISALSGHEILERKVSVQVARKPEPEGGERRKRTNARGRGRGRGRGGRFNRSSRSNKEKENGEGAPADESGEPALGDVTNGSGAEGAPKEKPRPRVQRHRGPPEDGIPSKTKVMVANLPYDLSEDKLRELFAAYEPSSAKIALRPIPLYMVRKLQARNEPRKGRGFGFVNLGSEELQAKAVVEMHGTEIEGREIAVKVAIDSPGKEEGPAGGEHSAEGTEAQQQEAPAEGGAANASETPGAEATA